MAYQSRRHKKTIYADINIVPFLDILLVLLLVFIATAPIITQSVQVDLPESSETQTIMEEDRKPIILEVSAIDSYTLIVDNQRNENLTKDQLIEIVKQNLQIEENNKKNLFLVGGAKEVPYEEVIKAIDILHEAGIKQVGLMTTAK